MSSDWSAPSEVNKIPPAASSLPLFPLLPPLSLSLSPPRPQSFVSITRSVGSFEFSAFDHSDPSLSLQIHRTTESSP